MSQKNIDVVRRAYEAVGVFEAGDEPVEELFDPEVELVNVEEGWLFTKPYSGYQGVRDWVRDIFDAMESPHFEVGEVIEVDDDWLVVSSRASGRGPGTGLPIRFSWWSAVRFRNGKILRSAGYRTREQSLEAVGLSE